MSDFIFSVNVTFPIFLVMALGYFLNHIGALFMERSVFYERKAAG